MSIEKKPNGYQVRYRNENGKQRAKTFKLKKDAVAFEVRVQTELMEGTWLDPANGKIQLSEVWEAFSASKKAKKQNTQNDYESMWRLHLNPEWGKTHIGKINQADFDRWVIGLNLSPQRIRKVHLLMSMILDYAIQMKKLKRNPLKNLVGERLKGALPDVPEKLAGTGLTIEELISVAVSSGYYEDLILFAGFCGPRWGELVGLQAQDLDVRKGKVRIARALVEINGKLTPSTTKTGRERTVDLPQILKDRCHNWLEGKQATDPLFTTEDGTLLRNSNFASRVFIPALVENGIRRIRIHDLRHTAASIAISQGATPNMVKKMLGHSDVQLTMRVYNHVFEADEQQVALNLDKAVYEVHQKCIDDKNSSKGGEVQRPDLASDLRVFDEIISQSGLRTADYEFGALTN